MSEMLRRGRILQRSLQAFVSYWVVALPACGDGGSTQSQDGGESTQSQDGGAVRSGLCANVDGLMPATAGGLTTADAFDYISIRETTETVGTRIISEHGQPCAGAPNSCVRSLREPIEPFVRSLCVQVCVEFAIVTTRGETVEKWATPSEVVEVLGPIDTPDDALMVVAANGHSIQCPLKRIPNYPEEALPSVERTERGFEVVATQVQEGCPVILQRVRLLVAPSGEVRELERKSIPWVGTCA